MSSEETKVWAQDSRDKLRELFLSDLDVAWALVKIASACPTGKFSLTPEVRGRKVPVVERIEHKDGALICKFCGHDPIVIPLQ